MFFITTDSPKFYLISEDEKHADMPMKVLSKMYKSDPESLEEI